MVNEALHRSREVPSSVQLSVYDLWTSVHDELHECNRKRSSSHWLSLNVAHLQNNQEKVCYMFLKLSAPIEWNYEYQEFTRVHYECQEFESQLEDLSRSRPSLSHFTDLRQKCQYKF